MWDAVHWMCNTNLSSCSGKDRIVCIIRVIIHKGFISAFLQYHNHLYTLINIFIMLLQYLSWVKMVLTKKEPWVLARSNIQQVSPQGIAPACWLSLRRHCLQPSCHCISLYAGLYNAKVCGECVLIAISLLICLSVLACPHSLSLSLSNSTGLSLSLLPSFLFLSLRVCISLKSHQPSVTDPKASSWSVSSHCAPSDEIVILSLQKPRHKARPCRYADRRQINPILILILILRRKRGHRESVGEKEHCHSSPLLNQIQPHSHNHTTMWMEVTIKSSSQVVDVSDH